MMPLGDKMDYAIMDMFINTMQFCDYGYSQLIETARLPEYP